MAKAGERLATGRNEVVKAMKGLLRNVFRPWGIRAQGQLICEEGSRGRSGSMCERGGECGGQ